MPKFCPKCGKNLKPGAKFCSSCGFVIKQKKQQSPAASAPPAPPAPVPPAPPAPAAAPPPPPPPPPAGGSSGSGCGTGCLVGCLIFILINLLIVGLIIGGGWWFLRKIKVGKEPGSYFEISAASEAQKTTDCGSSSACFEKELKSCSPAEGESDIGKLAIAEFEVLGISEDDPDSCVVYFKISEIKEMPEDMEGLPSFLIEKLLKDLSMECLIPDSIYKKGMDETGEYIGENMSKVCEGPLFDMAEKFGVDLED